MIKRTITNKYILMPMILVILFMASSCNTVTAPPGNTTNDKNNINETLAIYHKVLSGEISIRSDQTGDSSFSIDDVFLFEEETNSFSLYDVNNDGVPELHLSSPRTYYIVAYNQSGPYVLYYGTGYDRLLNNGALLYERIGGGPDNARYCYTWFTDGGGSFSFEKYDADCDGYTEEDFYLIDDQPVSQAEYNNRTQEYLTIGSDKPIWVRYESMMRK